jgi:hypothetical protein
LGFITISIKRDFEEITMKVGLRTILPGVAMLCLFLSPLAHADDPVLIKATFFSHTNDNDKDHDTGVYVVISTADGSSTIAHADNRDNSGDDATQYKDSSDHQFDLDLDAAGWQNLQRRASRSTFRSIHMGTILGSSTEGLFSIFLTTQI